MQSCSFIGHRNCPKETQKRLLDTIEELITNKNVTTFYVGTQGSFDRLVYEVLCELEKKHEIKVFVVLAYLDRHLNNEYCDIEKTIFPDELTKTPLRFAIRKRNSFMINNSDYVICYINTPFSNALVNIEEAYKKKKEIINLGEYDIQSIVI